MKFSLLLLCFISISVYAEDALKCNLVNKDDILKIKCKYMTASKEHDRNITISWTSPTTHQDDRIKTVHLPAYNISAYDFRYFDGRAEGIWKISALDEETGKSTHLEFVKEALVEEASTQQKTP